MNLHAIRRAYRELPRYVRYWSYRYNVEYEDAIQEFALYELEHPNEPLGSIRRNLRNNLRFDYSHVSLYAPLFNDSERTLLDMFPSGLDTEDTTYNRVYYAFRKWLQAGWITEAQAVALYLHAVESWPFARIDREYGVSNGNARFHYDHAIREIRVRNKLQDPPPNRVRRLPRGERHHAAKLSDRQRFDVWKEYYTDHTTQTALAKKYGVCQTTISDIIRSFNREVSLH